MKNIIFLLILIFCFINCERTEKNQLKVKEAHVENSSTKVNKNIQKYRYDENKSLIVPENSVLFFTLSKSQYNELKTNSKFEVDEILGDFYSSYNKVLKVLEEKNLNVMLSASDKIVFQNRNSRSFNFNWIAEMTKQLVGIAFFGKDNKPRIEYGVFDDEAILKMVKDYFRIKFD
jgi:hypothetical protein